MSDSPDSPAMPSDDDSWLDRFTEGVTFLSELPAASTASGQRVLALTRSGAAAYPSYQFDDEGRVRPVVTRLLSLGDEHGFSMLSVTQWTLSPTTYLNGLRPADLIVDDPQRVLAVAKDSWGIVW